MYVGVLPHVAEVRSWRSGHGHVALVEPQAVVDLVAERLLVLLGDAEQHADGAHRDLGAEVGDEVEAALADQRVELARGEGPDLRLNGGQAPRA